MAAPGRVLTPLCLFGALLHLAVVDPQLQPVVLLRTGLRGLPSWQVPAAALVLALMLAVAVWVGGVVEERVLAATEATPLLERPQARARARRRAIEAGVASGLLLGLLFGSVLAVGLQLATTGSDGRALGLLGWALGTSWVVPQAALLAVLSCDLWLMRRPFWQARRGLLLWTLLLLLGACGLQALRLGAFDELFQEQLLASVDSIQEELRQILAAAAGAEQRGDFAAAATGYQHAIDRNPARQRRHRFFEAMQEARMGLARSLAHEGHKKQALAVAKAAVDAEPEWFIGQRERGRVQRLLGDQKGGEQSLRRALQLCPTDAESLRMLVDDLMLQARSQDVVAVCRDQLAAFQYVELGIELQGAAQTQKLLLHGDWHQLELPVTGGDYHLVLQCRRDSIDLPLWVDGVTTASLPRIAEPSPAPTAPADVVAMALAGNGKARIELRGTVPPGQTFLRLRYLALTPLDDELLTNLRIAATGTVHPR